MLLNPTVPLPVIAFQVRCIFMVYEPRRFGLHVKLLLINILHNILSLNL